MKGCHQLSVIVKTANRCSQFGGNLSERLSSRSMPAEVAVIDSQSEVIWAKTLWNLLAYSGLREFFIREESSSRKTRLDWTQLGEVF